MDVVRGLPRRRFAGRAPLRRVDSPEDRRRSTGLDLRFPSSSTAGVRRQKRPVAGPADTAWHTDWAGARDGVQRRDGRLVARVGQSAREFLRADRAAHADPRGRAPLLRVGVPLAVAPDGLACQRDHGRSLPCLRSDTEPLWRGACRTSRWRCRCRASGRPDHRVAAATLPARSRERLWHVHRARAALRRRLPAIAAGPAGEPRPSPAGRGREPRAAGRDRRAPPRRAGAAAIRGEVRRRLSIEPVRDGDHALRRGPDRRRQRRAGSAVRVRT